MESLVEYESWTGLMDMFAELSYAHACFKFVKIENWDLRRSISLCVSELFLP